MKITKYSLSFLLAAATPAFLPTRAEATFVNFNSGYVDGSSLSGQQGWDTNNYSDHGTPDNFADDLGQSDFVGVIPGYSTTASDYWGLLGGASATAPVVNTSYLYLQPENFAGAVAAAFNVKFGITSSQTPNTNLDIFGWTFRDAAQNQLLRVGFIPDTNQPGKLTVRVYNSANAELAGSGSWDISYDAKYSLGVSVGAGGQVSVQVTDSLGSPATVIVNNQIAAGALPSLISEVAATWTVKNTTANASGERTNYGSNALLFDDYSISAVPEPSSLLLLTTGIVGALAARRRRRVS